MNFLVSIGLEVHVQLKTRSKMFCGCATEYGGGPNTRTCPVCLGLPGGLPVANREAIRLTLLTGMMLGCEIPARSRFDRKNYFYPDVAKNYQITQYSQPFCRGGRVSLHDLAYPKDAQSRIVSPPKNVSLVRIHLEEDVAKSFHFETNTGIDFNRAGTPLMEIVTEPEIHSPEEAFAFLSALKQILIHGGVSDADMEKGQLRCDCNVSLRPNERSELGAKIEIKNMNSISAVRRALAYEVERQGGRLARGEKLTQETRGWNEDAGETFLMRTKEFAHDYRYFPDPDLPPVETAELLEEARAALPELPEAKRARFVRQYEVTPYDAAVLASDLELAAYFERAAEKASKPKSVANWILNELQSALASAGLSVANSPVSPSSLPELVRLIDSGKISRKQAKEVFAEMFATGKSAAEIVQARGLEQVSDLGAIEKLCEEVIASNPKPVADFRAGNPASLNFLKGQLMKLSRGRANPQLAGEILERKLRG